METDLKYCKSCGELLVQGEFETNSNFKKREYCNKQCGAQSPKRFRKKANKTFAVGFGRKVE